MKIEVSEVLEIDADKWAQEFGILKSDVREDVKAYFRGWLQEQVKQLGLEERKDA